MKRQYKLLLVLIILMLSLGWVTTAWAAEPDAAGKVLRGQVTAIGDNSLTVQTPQTEVTLLTDAETVFKVPGVQNATLADINLDDLVAVRAVRNPQGEPLARRVAVIPNGSLKDKTLRGLVAAPDGATFQLRTGRGLVEVITDENTLFRIPNVENPTAADLRARMPVAVVGQFDAPDRQTFYAKAVTIIPGRIVRQHTARGKLVAIEDATLLLAGDAESDAPQRVQTNDETAYRVPGVENATLADLQVGDLILALGHRDENGDLIARSVAVVHPRPRQVRVYGQVTAVGDSSLTLKPPRRDALTVTITPETHFRLPGVPDPGLDDIAVGDRIGVAGRWNQDHSLHAQWVLRPRPKN